MLCDYKVCNTDGTDFYIVSQKTSQGTASPTHYTVVHNDIGPEATQNLQVLSYKLCYLYYNWTGSIKEPSPIRYAHTLSNLIGERYNPRKPETLILPHESYLEKKALYFI